MFSLLQQFLGTIDPSLLLRRNDDEEQRDEVEGLVQAEVVDRLPGELLHHPRRVLRDRRGHRESAQTGDRRYPQAVVDKPLADARVSPEHDPKSPDDD